MRKFFRKLRESGGGGLNFKGGGRDAVDWRSGGPWPDQAPTPQLADWGALKEPLQKPNGGGEVFLSHKCLLLFFQL